MPEALFFGTIFIYIDKHYVFLAEIEDRIYAARILNIDESKMIVNVREGKLRAGSKLDGILVYAFVELSTDGYEDNVASLNNTGEQKNPRQFLVGQDKLCKEDMISMRDEILSNPVPLELQENITRLNFDNIEDQ